MSEMFHEPWMRPRNSKDEKAVLSLIGGDLVILRMDFSQPDSRLKAQFAAWLQQVRLHAPIAAVEKKTKSTTDRGGRPTISNMRKLLKQIGLYRLSQHHSSQAAALHSAEVSNTDDYFPVDEVEWSRDYCAARSLLKKWTIQQDQSLAVNPKQSHKETVPL